MVVQKSIRPLALAAVAGLFGATLPTSGVFAAEPAGVVEIRSDVAAQPAAQAAPARPAVGAPAAARAEANAGPDAGQRHCVKSGSLPARNGCAIGPGESITATDLERTGGFTLTDRLNRATIVR